MSALHKRLGRAEEENERLRAELERSELDLRSVRSRVMPMLAGLTGAAVRQPRSETNLAITREEWARSFEELVTLLMKDIELPGIGYRSQFLYRGMSDRKWPLQTSLQRLGHAKEQQGDVATETQIELAILRAFRSYASEQLPSTASPLVLFRAL